MAIAPRTGPARAWAAAASLALAAPAWAGDRYADQRDFARVVADLQPGDTLHLAPGLYPPLRIRALNGRPDAPIVIAGPTEPTTPAVFTADPSGCCNTVEITNSSYVVLRRVTVDGSQVAGAFGVSAGGDTDNLVHDITVEGCTFVHHDGGQDQAAISVRTTTWGWVIRGNRIVGAGTGIHLGTGEGDAPFIGGLIEGNLVQDTLGAGLELKWQRARPVIAGMPTAPTSTVVRHNVWIKTDRAAPLGDRPNVVIGGTPDSGPGAMDRVEIYGNVFLHNARDSLLQCSGRVTIHDNLFVDAALNAVRLQNHELPLRQAYVYNNTIYAAGVGVSFGDVALEGDAVVGNLVFAETPFLGAISVQADNVTDAVANAGMYVTAPALAPGAMDFYPRPNGRARGAPLDLSRFALDRDGDRDFNCAPKGAALFRGAYAGEGDNPGWRVTADLPPVPATCTVERDAGADGGAPNARAGGCACRATGPLEGAAPRVPLACVAVALAAACAASSTRRRRA